MYVRIGVTYYIMCENLIWREFNLAIFYDLPNRQIKVLAKFSGQIFWLCSSSKQITDQLLVIHD